MSVLDTDRRVRVLLADDEPSIRAALALIVADEPAFDLVATATNTHEAVELAGRVQPDVAVIDVHMPGGGGIEAASRIREVSPCTAVVALSATDDRDSVFRMLGAGAVGYLVKGTPATELVEGIRRSVERQPTLSTEATAHVLRRLSADVRREHEEAHLRRERERRVQGVLHGEGLRLVFQPIVDLRSRRLVGYEALARFADARPPNEWFADAELVGLGTELELRAIALALDALADIPGTTYLAFNASPHTVTSPGLTDLVAGVPPGRVVVEVTEHAPIADYDEFAQHVQRLRAAGARLAVDDAGAGFACLKHIVRLAPDFIKLDLGITREVGRDRRFTALAAALVAFARETDAVLVAEGIETESQLTALEGLGVTVGQGYLLGRPSELPAPEGFHPLRPQWVAVGDHTTDRSHV